MRYAHGLQAVSNQSQGSGGAPQRIFTESPANLARDALKASGISAFKPASQSPSQPLRSPRPDVSLSSFSSPAAAAAASAAASARILSPSEWPDNALPGSSNYNGTPASAGKSNGFGAPALAWSLGAQSPPRLSPTALPASGPAPNLRPPSLPGVQANLLAGQSATDPIAGSPSARSLWQASPVKGSEVKSQGDMSWYSLPKDAPLSQASPIHRPGPTMPLPLPGSLANGSLEKRQPTWYALPDVAPGLSPGPNTQPSLSYPETSGASPMYGGGSPERLPTKTTQPARFGTPSSVGGMALAPQQPAGVVPWASPTAKPGAGAQASMLNGSPTSVAGQPASPQQPQGVVSMFGTPSPLAGMALSPQQPQGVVPWASPTASVDPRQAYPTLQQGAAVGSGLTRTSLSGSALSPGVPTMQPTGAQAPMFGVPSLPAWQPLSPQQPQGVVPWASPTASADPRPAEMQPLQARVTRLEAEGFPQQGAATAGVLPGPSLSARAGSPGVPTTQSVHQSPRHQDLAQSTVRSPHHFLRLCRRRGFDCICSSGHAREWQPSCNGLPRSSCYSQGPSPVWAGRFLPYDESPPHPISSPADACTQ